MSPLKSPKCDLCAVTFFIVASMVAAISPVFHRVVMSDDAAVEGGMRISTPFFQRPPRGARIVAPHSVAQSESLSGRGVCVRDSSSGSSSTGCSSALARDPTSAEGGIEMAKFFREVLRQRAYNRKHMLDNGFIDTDHQQ